MQLPLMITSRDKAIKALQDVQLEGLKEVDRICRKHNINYSLGGGTCLGQVRHGGFIPWDDDIDIDMTLENFERFVEVAPAELDSSRFHLYTRDTDPTIQRSFARLGILGTTLSLTNWEKAGRKYNVYIDILSCSYLPDDAAKRKRVSNRLFILRCVQHYKELGVFAAMLDPKHKRLVRFLSKVVPDSLLRKYEYRLLHCTGGRTGWLLDDSIIHGAYGGYRSEGVDEYEDVTFEGLTVMNKKATHDFLVTLYGEKYMEWLPPVKRISHHSWTAFDLGSYADKYDLDDSYKDFMSVSYTPAKLRQMKTVTDQIISSIAAVCDRHDIKYTVAKVVDDGINIEGTDSSDLWVRPGIVMMMRDEYERFAEVCTEEFGSRLSYQSHETNPDYYYDYARIHLNYTHIRDKHMRNVVETQLNSGFYVKIIPLDNYCKSAEADKNFKSMKFWRRSLQLKWRTPDNEYFRELSFRNKLKLLMLRGTSLEQMYNKVSDCAKAYSSSECDLCFDSSNQAGGSVFKKGDLLDTREIEVHMKSPSAGTMDELISSVSKRFGPCYLTYYDEPDRQLSILRYDEKNDRLLSNEELLGGEL